MLSRDQWSALTKTADRLAKRIHNDLSSPHDDYLDRARADATALAQIALAMKQARRER